MILKVIGCILLALIIIGRILGRVFGISNQSTIIGHGNTTSQTGNSNHLEIGANGEIKANGRVVGNTNNSPVTVTQVNGKTIIDI